MSVAIAGCSLNGKVDAVRNPNLTGDVTAFVKSPTPENFQPLHTDILVGPVTADAEIRLIDRLMAPGVPDRLVNGVIADLVAVDFLGTLRWVREINVAARVSGPPGLGSGATRRSAYLAWLMLAVRPFEDVGGADFTRMDLRSDAPFVGQNMNLQGANFTGTILPSGIWRNSDLTNAAFHRASAAGPLSCANCTWGSAWATLHYSGDRWVSQ